jgi:hypothetical protein
MLKDPMNFFETITLSIGALLLCGTAAQAAPVSGQGTWETTLQARDLNGDGVTDAFYDTELNVTWLRNADANGRMNWDTAKSWASALVVGGYSGWRMPTMVDTGAPGCDLSNAGGTDCGYNVQTKSGSTVYSEMAHLWYTTLGNKAICAPGEANCIAAQPGWGLSNTGNFQNMQSYFYWSGTQFTTYADFAWAFSTTSGSQGGFGGSPGFYAMAVRPGDVTAAIPEPETYALMLAGLAVVLLRRARANSSR